MKRILVTRISSSAPPPCFLTDITLVQDEVARGKDGGEETAVEKSPKKMA
jgi:hypothetical protein